MKMKGYATLPKGHKPLRKKGIRSGMAGVGAVMRGMRQDAMKGYKKKR